MLIRLTTSDATTLADEAVVRAVRRAAEFKRYAKESMAHAREHDRDAAALEAAGLLLAQAGMDVDEDILDAKVSDIRFCADQARGSAASYRREAGRAMRTAFALV